MPTELAPVQYEAASSARACDDADKRRSDMHSAPRTVLE